MARIETITEILYDCRSYKSARIVIGMEKSLSGDNYILTITDYTEKTNIIEQEGEEPIVSTALEFREKRTVIKTISEVDQLYAMVDKMIPKDIPFTLRQEKIEELNLLLYVQNDFIKDNDGKLVAGKTIYNLNPNQWRIKSN